MLGFKYTPADMGCDAEYVLFDGDHDTDISIQVARYAGGFFIHQYVGEGNDLTSIDIGPAYKTIEAAQLAALKHFHSMEYMENIRNA